MAERQLRLSQNSLHQHIWHVSQLLLEAARQRAYDGLILIATDAVAKVLDEALAPETRALVMGQIVRDFARFDMPVPCQPAEMRH